MRRGAARALDVPRGTAFGGYPVSHPSYLGRVLS